MSWELDDIRRKMYTYHETGTDNVFMATVKEINEEDFTCTVTRNDAVDYFGVRLRALINPELQGMAFIPREKSMVLVSRIGKSNELFICQYSEIDKIVFTNNDLEIRTDADKIDIRKGEKIHVEIDKDNVNILNGETLVRLTDKGLTIKKGTSGLMRTLDNLLEQLKILTVPTGVGPSGVPVNQSMFAQIQSDLKNYLEE